MRSSPALDFARESHARPRRRDGRSPLGLSLRVRAEVEPAAIEKARTLRGRRTGERSAGLKTLFRIDIHQYSKIAPGGVKALR